LCSHFAGDACCVFGVADGFSFCHLLFVFGAAVVQRIRNLFSATKIGKAFFIVGTDRARGVPYIIYKGVIFGGENSCGAAATYGT
jgi:hypothetical protein